MYQVNCKIVRKEGSKARPENYLVEAISLTDIDAKLNKEFKDMTIEVSSAKILNLQELFETGKDGSFFMIKISIEDIDSKVTKETFIQEASNHTEAEENLRNKIDYGEITDINLTNYMGVIR